MAVAGNVNWRFVENLDLIAKVSAYTAVKDVCRSAETMEDILISSLEAESMLVRLYWIWR